MGTGGGVGTRLTVSRYDGLGETAGGEWSGVAWVHDFSLSGSAVLLASGLHLLTAAHVVNDLRLANAEVVFDLASGRERRTILALRAFPGAVINEVGVWDDLALITLAQAAPVGAERYDIYTGDAEVGRQATLVGYGQEQDIYGLAVDPLAAASRRAGENTIDALGSALAPFGWQGSLDEQLAFDYDDGGTAHDSLGGLLGAVDLGLGAEESMITPGDSGGGLFVNEAGRTLLAGINSYVTRHAATDLSLEADGSVGDMGLVTRVGSYADWIETCTGLAQTPVARTGEPPPAVEVPRWVTEGQGVWFLVQLSGPALQLSQVDFHTRDGSATAGLDYIPTQGTVTLAEGERWAEIWVQTLADSVVEGEETFWLVLTNPVGGVFPYGQLELAAMRTIVDDITLTGSTQLAAELFA